ncbi:MAG: hypothetical protein NTU62_11925 [Spirochaetes bacterium]|nr:hypothetical protein [Spirochaetota bacterium]
MTGALGLLDKGDIPPSGIGTGGSFSFEFSTLAYSGPIAVTVEATDWNDNVGQTTVTLTEPDGQLSSFAVEPHNKSVTLDWDEVDGATYTVYYTTNGTIPTTSDRSVSPPAPPYDLAGLRNGDLHTFLLRAHLASGTDYWSGYVKSIPLSEMTLAPQVTGAYQKIELSWNSIDATDEFVILRSVSPSGPWADYTGVVVGTSFTDNGVSDNTWYYYKVRPSLGGSVESVANGGQTFHLPPYEVGSIISLDTPGTPLRLKAKGTKVFIAAGAAGMVVVDVADPYAPQVIATYPTTNAKDIELDTNGDFAFIADGTGGLKVVNVSNPAAPTAAGSLALAGDSTAVAVVDTATSDYAYVLDSTGITYVRPVNVTNRYTLSTSGSYSNASYQFRDVAATRYGSTTYLFLPSGLDNGLHKVTHTWPWTLSIVGSPFTDANYWTQFVAVRPTTTGTDCLYALSQRNMDLEPPPEYVLMAIRISDLVKQGESAIRSGWVDSWSDADVNLWGPTPSTVSAAYVADGIGLVSYDLSTPTLPVVADFWNIPGAPSGAASNGPYAFAAAGLLGFHLVSAGMPYAASLAWDGAETPAGIGIATRGDTVFMTVGAPSTPGIQAYDVTNPLAPVALGFTPLAGPSGIAISGDYAFVANGSTLKILDIRDPTLPLLVVGTAASRSGSLWSVAVSGDLAFLAGSSFQSFDISDPANPVYRGIHDSDGGSMNGVAARGRMAYVAEGAYFQPNSLKVLDLSNPAVPVLEGRGATSGMTMESVVLDGKWAFATDSFPDQGLWAVNVDPASPLFLAAYGPCDVAPGAEAGWAEDVFSYGGWAYITFDSASVKGISVVDVAAPTGLDASSLKSTVLLGGTPNGLTISGKWGYVANGTLGLQVIEVAP